MGKKSSKTTSESTPWAPAQSYLTGAAGTIQNTVNANQGNLNALAGQARDYAGKLGQTAFGSQPGVSQGIDYVKQSLGGAYLNSNPYIDQMAKLAGQGAANSVNSAFSLAGRTGGGNHATDLARGVAQAELGVRNQDYMNERQNQTAALGAIPGLIGSQYAGVLPYAQLSQTAGQLPYYGLDSLGNIGSLFGGYGKTSGTQPGGWGSDLLNAGASIASAAILASDRRLKTKIKLLRRDPDGLGWYEYAYKSAPDEMRIGVMADEVKALRPWAYVKGFVNGEYDGVDYAALKEAA